MTSPDWHEELIGKKHDRNSFDCDDLQMNEFLSRSARQNHEAGVSKTFLAISSIDGKAVLGFYSLCPASIEYARVPEIVRRNLAQYDVPAFRLGRLAVSLAVQGQGLGGQLLLSAGRWCLLASEEIGGVAMLIDAKNERATKWYSSCGAIALKDAPLTLVLPLATVKAALQSEGKL